MAAGVKLLQVQKVAVDWFLMEMDLLVDIAA